MHLEPFYNSVAPALPAAWVCRWEKEWRSDRQESLVFKVHYENPCLFQQGEMQLSVWYMIALFPPKFWQPTVIWHLGGDVYLPFFPVSLPHSVKVANWHSGGTVNRQDKVFVDVFGLQRNIALATFASLSFDVKRHQVPLVRRWLPRIQHEIQDGLTIILLVSLQTYFGGDLNNLWNGSYFSKNRVSEKTPSLFRWFHLDWKRIQAHIRG